ncbi:uncharacterized protein LOC110172044 isoform X2 [Boleophthalmus pectinirostris]|uniref:uncharacterized protein LOC110172044 isoform X2 n=1 Tax=Boleophthalmus pectinirostris TaxID=150288 RepID=UPI00242C7481|nr:uncharacterized protein LOC110172044 isoform X2 [Boleophthalmus pectinirostris]
MYNPYGNQRQGQGQYGANTNPDCDPRMGTTNMGLPFNPPGASGSANSLSSSMPMFSQPMSYRPESSRSDVDRNIDFQLSRAREEARLLNAPLSQPSTQPPSQMKPQREDIYSPFSTYSVPYSAPSSTYSTPSSTYSAPSSSTYSAPSSSTYSAPSSSGPRQPSRASDTDSGVGGSLSWLLNLSRSSSAEPRPFVSSSSSSSFQGGGESQRNRSESVIPGLGDYPDRMTPPPPQRKDSAPAKYSAETAANILRHFNLEKEDLEQLISYPENEITPDSLPLILRQIRIEKSRKSAATSSYKDSRMSVDGHQEPKQNKIMDYAKKDMPVSVSSSAMDYNMDRALQNTTSRDYAKDIPPIPSKSELAKESPPVLQPSKVIDYGHTGKYMGGSGGSDSMGTIARAIQGIMKIDTGFIREPLQPPPTTSPSMPAKPISSLVSPSQNSAVPVGSYSSLFSSTFTSASSDLIKKPLGTQAPTMSKSFSIPKQDTDFRQRKPEVFTEKVENVKPLSKLSPPRNTKKTGVVLVDSIKKPKDEGKKQDLPGLQSTAGQSPNVGISSSFVSRKILLPSPPKASPIPTLSSNVTGRPTIIPPAKPIPTVVSKNLGNLVPVMTQQKSQPKAQTKAQSKPQPNPKPAPAPPKASTAVKGLPTSAMMQDYAAASPRSFPHTCCLCHKECGHMKDWITHQNSSLHIEKCKFLRLIYPEWDGEVTPRDPKPASSAQPTPPLSQLLKPRRSYSRSPSPRRRDKRRSRSRSAHRQARRSHSVSPPSSSHRTHTRSRSRELREPSPRRAEERRSRQSPKRSDDKRASPKRSEERHLPRQTRRKVSPVRSRERRYSPLRYTPPRYTGSRYSPTRYSPPRGFDRYTPPRSFDRFTPPRGHDRTSLSPRERAEQARSSRETRSSSDKSSVHKSTTQRKKQRHLEEMTKHALESSSALKSLANTTDLPALAEMLVPVIMSQMKKMNPSTAPSTGTKKKVVKKPTTTTVKKTISTAAKPTAVKPSTMVRLGSIIPPLSHDDVVAFAEQFGKTKSVLLFRQKHQAVVCFEKEEDAKKLRNAKDIQIKEHPVTIVRYKEAVSTTQRKSPVSALKKPLKSVVKATTAGKSMLKSAGAKPTASRAPATKSTPSKSTMKKTSATPKLEPTMDKKAQESETDTSTTTSTVAAANNTASAIAEVVVTKDRKATSIQNMRTIQRSSLKEVPIQDEAKNNDAKQDDDDDSEVAEIKNVCMETIEISSGTDCENEERPKVNKMVVTTTAILTDKTDSEQMEEKAVTEEKTPNEETVESVKNFEQNLENDDLKIPEPSISADEKDLGKVEAKQVTEKIIPSEEIVGKKLEENLDKGDMKISEGATQQDQDLMEKDAGLTQKDNQNSHSETTSQQEKGITTQQNENSEPSTEADVAVEKDETIFIQEEKATQDKPSEESNSVKEVAVMGVQPQEGAVEQNKEKSVEKLTEKTSEAEEEKMEVLTTDAEKVQDEMPKKEDSVTPVSVEVQPDSGSKPDPKPDPKLDPKQPDPKPVSVPIPPKPKPNPSPKSDPLTLGETLDKLLTVSAFNTIKNATVLSPKFLQKNNKRVVLLSNLPVYNPEDPYTEEQLVTKLKPFGFKNEPNSIYILPQCKLAIVAMPNKNSLQELVKRFVECPYENALFRSSQLKPHVIFSGVEMLPMPFYLSLMRICDRHLPLDNGEKTVYITNIPQSDMAELQKMIKKIGFIKNYMPLLNKVFVEFESTQAADALGIYHSLLKRTPSYEMFRMNPPKNKGVLLSKQVAAKAMPDPSESVPGAVLPAASFGVPLGTDSPFWVTMTTIPYFYPTQSLWFLIPEYETLENRASKQSKRLGNWQKRTVMLTGLPVGGYRHEDVVSLVWNHLLGQHLHSLYYSIIVLPLQRRAFIHFCNAGKCSKFSEDYFRQKITLKGNLLHAHYVRDRNGLFPLSDEDEMYCAFMKLSNAGIPSKHLLKQRLLIVFVSEVSFDMIRLVIEIVTSVAPIFGYLPLANRICIEMADSNDVPKVKERFSSYTPEIWKARIWNKIVGLETCIELKERVKNSGNTVVSLGNPPGPKPYEKPAQMETETAKEESNTTLTEDLNRESRDKEEQPQNEGAGEVKTEETAVVTEKEKPKTMETDQKESSVAASSSAPSKEQGPDLPRLDEDMFRLLTAAVREHRRHKHQSSDSEQEDRKSQTSEDSTTRCGSSRDFPFEDLSDFVMVDEISEDDVDHSSSRHHHSSSSSTRRSSDSRRDKEKPSSSSSDRYHTSSRPSRESTKYSSSTSSSSRYNKDGFKSPSTCSSNSSSPRKASESSKSNSSSRSSTSHEKHSERLDKYKKDSEASKSGHKGAEKSSKSHEEKGKLQHTAIVVEFNKETVRELREVSDEGYEIIDAVDDQNCPNEMTEDTKQISEGFEVVDSVDEADKTQEEGGGFEESFQVLDTVTEEQAKEEPNSEHLSAEITNQELDAPQSMDSKPETRNKRKRDDNDGDVCSKTTKTDDQGGTEQETFEILDSIEDQTTIEDPQNNENDEKLVENAEFQVIDEVDDRPKSDSECKMSETTSSRSTRSGRQTRSEEKEKSPKRYARTARKTETKSKCESSSSRIDEEIIEEFKVVDVVEVEPAQDEEKVTVRRSTRGRREEKAEKVLDSAGNSSEKHDVSIRERRSRSVKTDSSTDEKLHKDDSKCKARNSQERHEHKKATKAGKDCKESSADLEQGAFEILDAVEEDKATVSEKSTKLSKTDLDLNEKSPKNEPSHIGRKSKERSESKSAAKNNSSTNLEQGAFEILDEVAEETATISEKSTRRKSSKSEKDTPSRSRQTPAKESQETKKDGGEETYTILDSVEVSTRSTRQTRSSQRDQSSDSSLKRNTPTKRGRTPASETKKSDTKDLPKVELQEAIEEEFKILDAVEDEPSPKGKRGRLIKQPPKSALKSDKKIISPLMEESMVEEHIEKQGESEVAMEISEEIFKKGVEEDEEEPVYEVIDSLEEDQIAEEQTACIENNMETLMVETGKNVSENVANAVEKHMEELCQHDSNNADDLAVKDGNIDEKDVKMQKEIGSVSKDGPEKLVEESPSRSVVETSEKEQEQSGNLSDRASQDLENKSVDDAAILEVEKTEKQSTRTTRSTRSGRACLREEISPKQRASRKSDTKQESIQKNEKKKAGIVEAKSENPESITLKYAVDEKYCVLDSVEDEKEDGEQVPQAAAKRRGRPRKQPRKSALKSNDVELKCVVVEDLKEGKTEDVSEKQKQEKSQTILEEVDKNEEDEEPLYEVLDAVEEDQEEDTESSEIIGATVEEEEGLIQKDSPSNEQDKLACGISQEIENAEVENVKLQKQNLETPEGIFDQASSVEIVENVQFVEKDCQATTIETKPKSEFSRREETRVGKPSVHDETSKILQFEMDQTCNTALENKMAQELANLISAERQKVDMNLDAVSDEEDFPEYVTEEEDGLVILDEIVEEEDEETELRIEEEGQNMERVEPGVDREELKTEEAGLEQKEEGVELEQKEEELKEKEEEPVKERKELKEEYVQEPCLLTQDQSEPAKPEIQETPPESAEEEAVTAREFQETDLTKAVKRKYEEDTEVPTFVTVDEVGEEEMEEQTPKGRGRGRKKGRKTPVRKSTRGRKVAQRDDELEEGQTEPVEGEALPSLSAEPGEKEQETAPSLELQPGTESEVEATQGQSLEMGMETDVRVGSKRKSFPMDLYTKRSRSQSPSVRSDTKLPPFRPNHPLGQDFVVPKSGYFCNLCSVFYLTESTAREQHCSSRRHYDNLKKHLERQSRAASEF